SQRMLSGIQVIDGRGRSRETKGSMMALAGHQTPMITPSGTATTVASANPRNTRREEAMIACQSSPVPTSLPASVATARGEGRKIVETQPYSVAALQSARNAQTERIWISRLSRTRSHAVPPRLGLALRLAFSDALSAGTVNCWYVDRASFDSHAHARGSG